jgi:hypothetical protein
MVVENESYWQKELRSLGIKCKRKNELNDKEELKAPATAVKEVNFQGHERTIIPPYYFFTSFYIALKLWFITTLCSLKKI